METRRSPSIDAHGGGPTDYPRIDADPHFGRVVRYFRPSDYGVIVASTAAVPATFIIWSERFANYPVVIVNFVPIVHRQTV